jgi:hypothetical protein
VIHCLLFDYAIEPITLMLKSSPLKGYKIPNLPKRLIASLFADDTTVYLREDDHFPNLLAVLHTWCRASGAKFNMEKTAIFPSERGNLGKILGRPANLTTRTLPSVKICI